jgi:hypothetical protein
MVSFVLKYDHSAQARDRAFLLPDGYFHLEKRQLFH